MTHEELLIYCDGGARGNPGPAAYGVSIMTPDGTEIEGIGECIGIATNNVAEYSAAVRGLERARELGAKQVVLRSDSLLMIQQLKGVFKVKSPNLQTLHRKARDAARDLEAITYEHVRREYNVRADELVNIALDAQAASR